MARTPHFGWRQLETGDGNYPQNHANLVESIDASLHSVAQTAGGGTTTTDVTTTAELEQAFDGLADGEHIHITGDNAPYRTTQYLDIDANDVLVTGHGPRPLVMPADGANVGGIRIGQQGHVERVRISGFSYDGNPDGQTMDWGGFGIASYDAAHVTVENCDIRRTVPYHVHNQANSGVSVYEDTRFFTIRNNHFEDIGDRAIEAAGSYGWVVGNTSKDGFDRMIALEAVQQTDPVHAANHVVIIGNRLDTNVQGSMIGGGGGGSESFDQRDFGNIVIANNVATGEHRRFVHLADVAADSSVLIVGNQCDGTLAQSECIEVNADTATVANNRIHGYQEGVHITAPETIVTGNRITDCAGEAITCLPAGSDAGTGDGPQRSVVQNNVLANNGANGTTTAEIHMEGDHIRVTNNHILSLRAGVACFENPAGAGGIIAWNTVPDGATIYGTVQTGTKTESNFQV